jgi:hypothetical protein
MKQAIPSCVTEEARRRDNNAQSAVAYYLLRAAFKELL